MEGNDEIVRVKNLSIGFSVEKEYIEAVDRISFTIKKNECVGLVGESGCGKTVSSMAVVRLLPVPPAVIRQGEIFYKGKNILKLPAAALKDIRGKEVGIVFQEPMTSLNPVKRIGWQVSEPLRIHFPEMKQKEIYERSISMLRKVGLPDPEQVYASFPHVLSGGMRQRVVTATAMILQPSLLIADEPTTALDVTIQAQIMDLIKSLQREFQMSVLLITHNLGLVADICERVIVMYAGRIAEVAYINALFKRPLHPYTKGLLASIPVIEKEIGILSSVSGSVPHPKDYLPGCRFLPRCKKRFYRCESDKPPPLFNVTSNHSVACWLYETKGVTR
jgi:oligopeptide/dipeptide ABC transporter ATP-binding protein